MIRPLEMALEEAIGQMDPCLRGVMGADPRTRARRATAVAQAEMGLATRQGREPRAPFVQLLMVSRRYLAP